MVEWIMTFKSVHRLYCDVEDCGNYTTVVSNIDVAREMAEEFGWTWQVVFDDDEQMTDIDTCPQHSRYLPRL